MSANHVYFVKYKNEVDKWQRSQGVTGALEELYDQKALISWAAGQSASKTVKMLAGPDNEKWLDSAFLSIYKGESPAIPSGELALTLSNSDLVNLYQEGVTAHVKKAQYGKDVGTQVHDAIDNYHRTGERIVESSGDVAQDDVALVSFEAYIDWYTKSGLKVLETERVVHSKAYNYCGTLDRIYIDRNGGLILGDFKTSNVSRACPTGVRAQYWSQVGAYALAYSEETGLKFVDLIIVNCPKNGKTQVIRGSSLEAPLSPEQAVMIWKNDLQAFRNHKQVTLAMKGIKSEV